MISNRGKSHNFKNKRGPEPPTHCTKVITSRNRMRTYEIIPNIHQQDWLARGQYYVTGWGIMFICGVVLRCAGNYLISDFSLHLYSKSDNHRYTYL